MTTYTAIPSGDVDPDSPVTTGLITKLRDNPIAITEGASGAPRIVNAAIDVAAAIATSKIASDGGIAQGYLKTTTQAISESGTTLVNKIMTGGLYCLWFEGRNTTGGAGHQAQLRISETGSSYASQFAIRATTSGLAQYNIRYIQASPPWNLGDGDIALFVYLVIDNSTRDILSVSISPDPTWGYNGPTIITPHRINARTGKAYRSEKDLSGIETLEQAKARGGNALTERAALVKAAPMVEYEITQAIKNADMDLFPHPHVETPAGSTVVMVDPVSTLMEDLLILHEAGESLTELFHGGFINVDNDSLSRGGPASMQISTPTWKLT